jgi:hypothetical protein
MDWRIIVGAAALGALALTLALLSDRRSRRRRQQEALPPDRTVPGLAAGAVPAYVSAEAANTPPRDRPLPPIPAAERDTLRGAGTTPQLGSGWADLRFVTDQESGWAVLHDPLVEKAGALDRPLVVVAGEMEADALDTLAVNVVQQKRRALVVKHPASELRGVALELGVDVVDRSSLQAGWCPPATFAHVTVWVSSVSGSWFMR